MFGILNVDKPTGKTSRDVVNMVQRLVRPAKVGHAGTLDPLATGVLLVCLGPATRLVPYLQRMKKSYRGAFLLGQESPTEDVLGEVVEHPHATRPTASEIACATQAFVGRIEQVPPAFSALKIAGRRAYDLARSGEAVQLSSRPVDVYRFDLVAFDYPRMVLEIECGGGTYVRSLGRDLARSLGTTAVMSELRRTAIGNFRDADAAWPAHWTLEAIAEHMLPPRLAVSELPTVTLRDDQVARIRLGQFIERPSDVALVHPFKPMEGAFEEPGEWAAVDGQGELIALLRRRGNLWGAACNFHS